MNPQSQFCHKPDCPTRGQTGLGNITIHSRKEKRYRCTTCKGTFTTTKGTPFFRLHTTTDVVTVVLTLLVHGCPRQAIVAAFGLDERTVAAWQSRAGQHAQAVHQHLVAQGKIELEHVQADELWVKMVGRKVWLAMAMSVPSRLWLGGLGGVVSAGRDRALITQLMGLVRGAAANLNVLFCVDGFGSYIKVIGRVFRVAMRPGGASRAGRPRLLLPQGLMLGQVVKQYAGRHRQYVVGVSRRVVLGSHSAIKRVLAHTGTGSDINTAYIERLNATFRGVLVPLVRRGRALARTTTALSGQMWLMGTAYNFCWEHAALRQVAIVNGQVRVQGRTPAMAAGLADHCWTMGELLTYQVPAPVYIAPKRAGRPPKPRLSQRAQMPQVTLAARPRFTVLLP